MSIEAMKQALEALDSDDPSIQLRAAVVLRQAIEQAEKQEPSLWFAIGKDGRVKYTTDSDRALKWKQAGSYRLVRDYYTSPVHARDTSQERVDETEKDRHDLTCVCGAVWAGEEMVCSPRKREWVGLTDEEIYRIWITSDDMTDRYASIKKTEAKLKEKNHDTR